MVSIVTRKARSRFRNVHFGGRGLNKQEDSPPPQFPSFGMSKTGTREGPTTNGGGGRGFVFRTVTFLTPSPLPHIAGEGRKEEGRARTGMPTPYPRRLLRQPSSRAGLKIGAAMSEGAAGVSPDGARTGWATQRRFRFLLPENAALRAAAAARRTRKRLKTRLGRLSPAPSAANKSNARPEANPWRGKPRGPRGSSFRNGRRARTGSALSPRFRSSAIGTYLPWCRRLSRLSDFTDAASDN